MVICMVIFYGIFSLLAVNKAFKTTGWVILLLVYIIVLVLGLVDLAKRKEEGYPE